MRFTRLAAATGPPVAAAVCAWFGLVPTASWRRAYDLAIYLEAGRAVLHRDDPYAVVEPSRGLGFTYPPIALLPFMLLGRLPLDLAYLLWLAFSAATVGAFVLWASKTLAPKCSTFRLAVASTALSFTDAIWDSMTLGQVSVFVGVLTLYAVMDSRPPSALAAGVGAAIKLIPLSAGAAFLAQPRAARRLCWMLASAGVLTLLGWLAFPSESRRYWTELVFNSGRVGSIESASNTSIGGVLAHLGATPSTARATGLAVTGILAVAWTVAVRYQRPPSIALAIGVTCLPVLGLPVSWSHHAIGASAAALALVLVGRTWLGVGLGSLWTLPLFEWAVQLPAQWQWTLQVVRPATLVILVVLTMTSHSRVFTTVRSGASQTSHSPTELAISRYERKERTSHT